MRKLLVLLLLSGCVTAPKQSHDTVYMDQSFTVDVTECRSENPTEKSLIILPPTGGTNLIDRSYAKRFCNDGWDVYILNDWSRVGETGNDLGFHNRAYTNSNHAMQLALDKIKTPFVGLIGTSVGATYATVAANTFAQLNAVFFIVGGVPLPQVIATSDHPSMVKFHKERFEKFHFANDEEYEAAIFKEFPLEPTHLGDTYKGKTYGAVVATNDTTVPYATQKNLVEFFKPTTVLERSSSHFWAIVKTWLFDTDRLEEFFNKAAAAKTP